MIGELGIAPFVEFGFMRRALVGCLALSLGATPVGVFLMLRRMSLTGDAMAHAILPGAALGYLLWGLSLGALTLGGLAAGLAVALLAGAVARGGVLGEDASLAAFYLISLALGVLLICLKGSQVDLFHVLFGYYADAYAIDFLAPVGVNTEAEASAADMAALIRQIRAQSIPAVFVENISDPRLLEQIRRETGARTGGTLYSDALSSPYGPAGTYLDMMRHNLDTLTAALVPAPEPVPEQAQGVSSTTVNQDR